MLVKKVYLLNKAMFKKKKKTQHAKTETIQYCVAIIKYFVAHYVCRNNSANHHRELIPLLLLSVYESLIFEPIFFLSSCDFGAFD